MKHITHYTIVIVDEENYNKILNNPKEDRNNTDAGSLCWISMRDEAEEGLFQGCVSIPPEGVKRHIMMSYK